MITVTTDLSVLYFLEHVLVMAISLHRNMQLQKVNHHFRSNIVYFQNWPITHFWICAQKSLILRNGSIGKIVSFWQIREPPSQSPAKKSEPFVFLFVCFLGEGLILCIQACEQICATKAELYRVSQKKRAHKSTNKFGAV